MGDRHREFEAAKREEGFDPLTFTLAGQPFKCIDIAPAGVLTDFVFAFSGDNVGVQASSLANFITSVLDERCERCNGMGSHSADEPNAEGSYDFVDCEVCGGNGNNGSVKRFIDLLHDKNTIIEIDTLGQLCEWIAEEYTGRPTQPSSR